jgi:hypothetical protein
MKIKRAYFLPVFVSYTERIRPPKAGCLWFCFLFIMIVRIRPEYKEDKGLLEHELEHCRQNIKSLFLHPVLYCLFSGYRYLKEIDAYAWQLTFYKEDRVSALAVKFSEYISEWYRIDITAPQAYHSLISRYKEIMNGS